MARLPDAENLLVAVDTETSGLHVDDGSRVAVVSWAYRQPVRVDGRWVQRSDAEIVRKAVAFDQGVTDLPLGEKDLPSRHLKRIGKTKPMEVWRGGEVIEVVPAEHFYTPAPNLTPDKWDALMGWLGQQRLIYHNAKFDMQQIRAGLRGRGGAASPLPKRRNLTGRGVDLEGAFWYDTQLAQLVLDPRFGTSLKPTSERLSLGASVGIASGHEADEQRALGPWKGPKTDPRFDLIPWWAMEPYATGDPLLTLLLAEYQGRLIEEDQGHWWSHIDRQFDLMIALYRMENRGIGFDPDGCRKQRDRLEIAKEKVAERLPFDPTPDKARRYFFNDPEDEVPGLGVIPRTDKMTEGGKPQVDEEVIKALTQHADERVQEAALAYQQHEEVKSAIVKWYGAWPEFVGPDGRLRTSYRQAQVVSGRLSVERVQLQAIPHDYLLPDLKALGAKAPLTSIREFFEPRPGYELWELDVANAEPRIATMVAKCAPMYQRVVIEGQDTHGAATILMFGDEIPPDAEGHEFGPEHADWTEYRQVGKRCNLGILYAAGPGAIREQIRKFTGIDYPYKQVDEWVRMYKKALPQFVQATEYWSRFADRNGYVRLIDGRLSYIAAHEPLHKAFNRVIQGSVAVTMADAMVDVEDQVPDAMLLQVHDSLVMEVPSGAEGVAQFGLAAALVRVAFEKAFRLRWKPDEPRRFMPFPVDCAPFGVTKRTAKPTDQADMEDAIDTAYRELTGRGTLAAPIAGVA